jgi:hypothetical protein
MIDQQFFRYEPCDTTLFNHALQGSFRIAALVTSDIRD